VNRPKAKARGMGFGEALASTWPVAVKNLRRFWLQNLLLAALLGVSLAGYVLFSFYMGTGGITRPPAFPDTGLHDMYVAVLPAPERLADLQKALAETTASADVTALECGVYTEQYTNAGELPVLGLASESRLWERLGVTAPPAGSVLIPAELAGRAGLGQGSTLALVDPASGQIRVVSVAGTFRPPIGLLDVVLGVSDAAVNGGNLIVALVGSGAAGTSAARAWLDTLQPVVLQGPDFLPSLWDRLRFQVTAPGSTVVTMIFLFAALGVMSVLFLSFLDRRPELAILKTVGVESVQITAMFVWEVFVAALAGAVIGGVLVAAGRGILGWLGTPLAGGAGGLVAAFLRGLGGLVVFTAVGAALPVALARAATVNELLNDAGIYLIRRRVEAWHKPV